MKIVLIGFMGSGKSSVAALLSQKIKHDLIETDQLILQHSALASISEIFEKFGEEKFRELERQVAKDLHDTKNAVISPGGGMIINDVSRVHLRNNAVVIYLETDFDTIKARIEKQSLALGETRPLFSDLMLAKQLYKERLPIYKDASDFSIKTDDKTIERICDEIISVLAKSQN